MDAKLLLHLSAIVAQGSLSRAARHLGVTQPTLTRSVQALEDRVGRPVLTRTRYGMQPTEAGLRLAAVGDRIADESAHADELARQMQQGVRDEVRVGVGPLIERAVLHDFVANYPRSRDHVLHFRVGSAALLLPELRRGTIDLLLAPKSLDLEQSSLHSRSIFEDRIRIMVGARSRFRGLSREVAIEELSEETWILSGASAGIFEGSSDTHLLPSPSMVFTGAINFVTHLLKTTDVVVRMPEQLMLLAGAVEPDQILETPEPPTRRDLAIWQTEASMERDAVRHVEVMLADYFEQLPTRAAGRSLGTIA